MIAYTNYDSSFFDVSTPIYETRVHPLLAGSIIVGNQSLNPYVVSFSITEEISRVMSGNIVLNDPDNMFPTIFRRGIPLTISWGWRTPDIGGLDILRRTENFDEVFGATQRTGIRGFVTGTGGRADQSGTWTFNLSFLGREALSGSQRQVYGESFFNKNNVIVSMFAAMGVLDQYVDFARGPEPITADTQVIQTEGNMKFLIRMAREWGAIFRIGHNRAGLLAACFVSPQVLNSRAGASRIAGMFSGATAGSSIRLDYRQGSANVVNYSWSSQTGESGDGCSVTMGADGRMVLTRYIVEGESITAYTLNMDRVNAEFHNKTAAEIAAIMASWYTNTNWEEIKRFFIPQQFTTAPQGLGYTMEVKMIGNPMVTAPMRVQCGEGFPAWAVRENAAGEPTFLYITKATHTIDQGGYFTNISLADAYTLTGGSLVS